MHEREETICLWFCTELVLRKHSRRVVCPTYSLSFIDSVDVMSTFVWAQICSRIRFIDRSISNDEEVCLDGTSSAFTLFSCLIITDFDFAVWRLERVKERLSK